MYSRATRRIKVNRNFHGSSIHQLKENIQRAMASVSVELIRKWEHRAWRFIDAYGDGLGAKEAQKRVKQFSSYRFKSHRRVSERTGDSMDA
ncbi:hypothetical protein C8J57DRAFT_1084689 [Mycena rebaudengoi]|nr:hypothetical protein C8J57DRAFT_1084689 [Mycena rebaudengoi]